MKPHEDKTDPLFHPVVHSAMKDAPAKQKDAFDRDGRKPYKISPAKK